MHTNTEINTEINTNTVNTNANAAIATTNDGFTAKTYLHHFRTLSGKDYEGHEHHGKKRPSLEFSYNVPIVGSAVTQDIADLCAIAAPKLMLEMLQHKDNLLNWDFVPSANYADIVQWFDERQSARQVIYTKANLQTCKPLFASMFTLAGKSQAWINAVLQLADSKFIQLSAHVQKAEKLLSDLDSEVVITALQDDSITRNKSYDLMLSLLDAFGKELRKIVSPGDEVNLDDLL